MPAKYKRIKCNPNGIQDVETGVSFNTDGDQDNHHYRKYLEWLKGAGNKPDDAEPCPEYTGT
tara:strand:+ start:219 stop:404 length:186 start_codon:yes stop_codon:yes gene_type:complete